ncbi:SPJ_0845 family protein [Pediococcus stilesii]|uniref:SPJ_0845 family protein n=1 Tax=Pediococcus stilesii TaxID=331679 RepID=UPI0022A93602|nr:SPJ_0845 family protein [Pediococcus stilesii]
MIILKEVIDLGLTVKRTTDLEKMLGQFTTKATNADEEKKKKDKFLAKDGSKKDQKK